MAHHQGMTIVAIANVLLDGDMRTGSTPSLDPGNRTAAAGTRRGRHHYKPRPADVKAANLDTSCRTVQRHIFHPRISRTRHPFAVQRRYTVMLTAPGTGYSRWRQCCHHSLAGGRDMR